MKILLVVLAKSQYQHHIEYWERKGHKIIAVNFVDTALLELKNNDDVDLVLVEPVLPKPLNVLFTENQLEDIPFFSAQVSGKRSWGITFWYRIILPKNIPTFFLTTIKEMERIEENHQSKELKFILVPSGPEVILEEIIHQLPIKT